MKEKLFVKENVYMMLGACLIPLFVVFFIDSNLYIKLINAFIPPTLILYCSYMDDIRPSRLKGLRLSEFMLGCGIGIGIHMIIMNAFMDNPAVSTLILCLILHLCVMMVIMEVLKVRHRIGEDRERKKPFPVFRK